MKIKFGLVFCFFFFTNVFFGQQKETFFYKDTSLEKVLLDIEKIYKVRISFAKENISGVTISISRKTRTLPQLLEVLSLQTQLIFDEISDKEIIISPQKKDNTFTEILNEVIIQSYITSGINKHKNGSLSVSAKALAILPGLIKPDITQSIQLIPGITSIDESATNLQIRGGASDQNLILLDGIKLYNTGYLYGMFSAFNPYATEKATIYKSAPSVDFGDRISGIIDISTGDKIPNKTKISLGLDGLSADAYLKTRISDKIGFYLFMRRAITDVYKSFTYNAYASKIFKNNADVYNSSGTLLNVISDDEYDVNSSENNLRFYDINTKLIIKPSEKETFEFAGLFTNNTINFSFLNSEEQKQDLIKTSNRGLSLFWKKELLHSWKQEVSSYYSNYDSDFSNTEIIENVLEENNLRKNNVTDIGFNYKLEKTFLNKHFLSFGYQYSNVEVSFQLNNEKFIGIPTEKVERQKNNTHTLFGEYQYHFKNKGLFSFGLRGFNYSSVQRSFVEPRLNFEYPFSDVFRMKVSAEMRHQPVSQLVEFNNTELHLEDNIWRLSDTENYPLLKSSQFSSGFLINTNGWTFDLDGYYKNITGLTSYTNGFSNPVIELSEGKSSILGFDFLVKKKINNYKVWLGYTYNNINFTFKELQEKPFPGNNDITHSFKLSNTYKLNNYQFSLGWFYRTGTPFTPIKNYDSNTKLVTFEAIQSGRLKPYHRLDASIHHPFKIYYNKKSIAAEVGFSILNIYNRKTPISLTHRVDLIEDTLFLRQVIQRFSLGTTTNISFRVSF